MQRVKHLKSYEKKSFSEPPEPDEAPLDPITEIAFFEKTVRRVEVSDSEKERDRVNSEAIKSRCVIL